MLKLDNFLELLKDGAWHNLNDLSKTLKIPEKKLAPLTKLLSEANILEYKTENRTTRLKEEWIKLLENTENEEGTPAAALGTIILPPRKTISLQNIKITNLTEDELELGLRANNGLEELAIGTIK